VKTPLKVHLILLAHFLVEVNAMFLQLICVMHLMSMSELFRRLMFPILDLVELMSELDLEDSGDICFKSLFWCKFVHFICTFVVRMGFLIPFLELQRK